MVKMKHAGGREWWCEDESHKKKVIQTSRSITSNLLHGLSRAPAAWPPLQSPARSASPTARRPPAASRPVDLFVVAYLSFQLRPPQDPAEGVSPVGGVAGLDQPLALTLVGQPASRRAQRRLDCRLPSSLYLCDTSALRYGAPLTLRDRACVARLGIIGQLDPDTPWVGWRRADGCRMGPSSASSWHGGLHLHQPPTCPRRPDRYVSPERLVVYNGRDVNAIISGSSLGRSRC